MDPTGDTRKTANVALCVLAGMMMLVLGACNSPASTDPASTSSASPDRPTTSTTTETMTPSGLTCEELPGMIAAASEDYDEATSGIFQSDGKASKAVGRAAEYALIFDLYCNSVSSTDPVYSAPATTPPTTAARTPTTTQLFYWETPRCKAMLAKEEADVAAGDVFSDSARSHTNAAYAAGCHGPENKDLRV